MKKILISIVLFLLALCLLPSLAHAQTFSLGVYPPLLEVMIQPGKIITQVYKIKNSGTNVILTPHIVPFEVDDEFGNIKLHQPGANSQTPSWFSLNNADRSLGQSFSLPSGRTQELVLKIKMPPDTKEADHYFSLILTTSPTPPEGTTKTKIQGVIASNILLTISKDGQPRKLAEVVEFRTKKLIDSFDQPVFTVKIKNIGKAFFKPIGNISVKNETLDLLEENVLVNSIRQIQCRTSDKVTPCQLESKFLMGRYQAVLQFTVNGESYQAKTIFYALPIKLSLALLTTIILLLIIKSRLNWSLTRP
jgi:hypothetical protein